MKPPKSNPQFPGLGGHHATANDDIIGRVCMLIVCLVDNHTQLSRVESDGRNATRVVAGESRGIVLLIAVYIMRGWEEL